LELHTSIGGPFSQFLLTQLYNILERIARKVQPESKPAQIVSSEEKDPNPKVIEGKYSTSKASNKRKKR